MTRKFNWKKKLFSNTNSLFEGNNQVGSLITRAFSNSAEAKFNDHKIRFSTSGLFNQKTDIIDLLSNKVLGAISYNTFKTQATITISDEVIEWKSLNWNNSRWGLTRNGKEIITSYNRMLNGEIYFTENDPLLILTGFYIFEYFNRSYVAVFTVLFIIILASN